MLACWQFGIGFDLTSHESRVNAAVSCKSSPLAGSTAVTLLEGKPHASCITYALVDFTLRLLRYLFANSVAGTGGISNEHEPAPYE